jgi:hypothetical protein
MLLAMLRDDRCLAVQVLVDDLFDDLSDGILVV